MRDRRDRAPPRHAHHLRRLIRHHAPAFSRQRPQRRRHMRRHEVMKDDHCGCFEVRRAGERVPRRRFAVVIAVDERKRPAGAGFAEAHDRLGALLGMKDRGGASACAADHLLKFAPPIRVREQGFDNIERRDAGGDEIGGRPAAPCADLDPAPPLEGARVGVEDRGLVAIDEAHGGIAPVDAKRMVDVLAEIGPGRGALVRLDHVRKQMVENRRCEVVGDIILGHRLDLRAKEQDRPRRRLIGISFSRVSLCGGPARMTRIACAAARRQERWLRRRHNGLDFSPLVLGLFSPYLLFDPEKRGR